MFILNLTYKQSLDMVEQYLDGHRQFLKKYYQSGHFVCSGPKTPRVGGVILAKADSLEKIQAIITEDPFWIQDIAQYEIIEFQPTMFSDAFKPVAE